MDTDDSLRTLSSALAVLSLAQSFMLDELSKIDPAAAKRVMGALKDYAAHVDATQGTQSIDAATTHVTVRMITRDYELEVKE